MEISNVLDEFDDLYMVCDLSGSRVLEVYPPIPNFKLPCNILSFFQFKNFNLDINQIKQIEHFLNQPVHKDCLPLKGNDKWYSLEYRKLSDDKDVLHLFDLDNSMVKMEEIISKSQLDPLTNTLQKNAIEVYVDSILKEDIVSSATMFMMDIDYFKNINDNYGHLFGDKVIVAIAEALMSLTGTSGKVGRIGGDEFILFIERDLDRMGIKNIARLIRYVLDNLKIDGKLFSITTTIGISQYPKDGTTFKELYTACDKALYRGKDKGRDCHIIFDPLVHKRAISPMEGVQNNDNLNKLSSTAFIGLVLERCLEKEEYKFDSIFSEIADFLNLDRIVLYRNQNVKVLYCKKEEDKNVDSYFDFQFERYKTNFVTDNLYYINDVNTWLAKDESIYNIYAKAGTTSTIQVLVFDKEDQCDGFISFETLHSKRVWQRGELNAIAILTKIINIISNRYKN